ncbi:putative bifunctional diguanylate cyclase/phosphodiesterase [Actinosynnema mirum]|uniref:Diguanylate cyclase/phosphodiesterase with PAS/PAC sensor(S) n=1 Tax=Actinosynnema mirum (strain ATCC 29888 / DSM 43827 / JCM 3225 / NBRC 14064 / NCIMB 13271 / NRRL B-12336 / IMRU 3971 / 101) TaxID=446462 RepID=C6W9U5_ACTMD|nr:EAL domain-containing protein [Actinosynnema mirum]ACU37312.1 diguanylate cyclase/phosphodiesterase with PAS/PAC sensor(s) [Actinosynnema mirum DSM 43827]AXX30783.1 diguanylate cyclase/phosphodiesterase (GGDEF & EAL domains) with PAS/PAC sensor(s) [Actinosynnema pretiosum subsp. pretiosum]
MGGAWHREVLQRTDIGYGVTDPATTLRWANPALAGILGIDPEHLPGRSLSALLPGAPDRPRPGLALLTPAGEGHRWLEVTCQRLDASGGDLLYRVADVTAWRDRELEATHEADALRRAQVLGRMGTWEWHIAEDRVEWSDTLLGMFGYPAGTALDYAAYTGHVHPDDLPTIQSTLTEALRTGAGFSYTHRMTLGDGVTERWFECFGEVVTDPDGTPQRVLGTAHDITQSRRVHDELLALAEQDPLTGLANRRAVTRELERRLATGGTGSLLLLDLDNFKDVNDLRGHAVGDRLMRALAAALRTRLEPEHLIGRLGGDEFAVVLPDTGPADAARVAEHLRDTIARLPLATPATRTTISTGVAGYGTSGDTWELVLANADLALYASKAAGRNRVTVYEPGHYADTAKRVSVLDRLRGALDGGGLALHAMPMVRLATGRVLGHELLLRLEDGQEPRLGPADFLPEAERTNLVHEIDRWVLATAIDTLVRHPDPELRFNVNVSGRTLEDPEFGGFVLDRLAGAGVAPGRLGIEITETAAVTNLDAARTLAHQLRGHGCRIVLDDFGSGFGSFVHLKHLPITGIKIDGEFVRGIDERGPDAVLVSGIMRIAQGLGLSAVAEWVERPEQVRTLTSLGVRVGQGFHLGGPVPLGQVLSAQPQAPDGALSPERNPAIDRRS